MQVQNQSPKTVPKKTNRHKTVQITFPSCKNEAKLAAIGKINCGTIEKNLIKNQLFTTLKNFRSSRKKKCLKSRKRG